MTPAEVALAYLASFATGDPERVTAMVTDDFVNEHTSALGSGCVGKQEYSRRVPGFLAGMPGLHYDIVEVISQEDRVAVAYVLHTTVNERDVAVPGLMRFRIDGERVAHRVDYWDSLVFQRQAGLST